MFAYFLHKNIDPLAVISPIIHYKKWTLILFNLLCPKNEINNLH